MNKKEFKAFMEGLFLAGLFIALFSTLFIGSRPDSMNFQDEMRYQIKQIKKEQKLQGTQLDRIEENTTLTRQYWVLAMFNWGWLSEPHQFIARLPEALYYYEKIEAAKMEVGK